MRGRKLFTRIVLIAIIAVVAHIALIGDYSLTNVGSLYLEKEDLKKTLAEMEHEKDSLLLEEERVGDDPFELERLAREKAGMVKPGEKLFKAIIVDGPANEGETAGEVVTAREGPEFDKKRGPKTGSD